MYAPRERLFDSFWILPKHKLEAAFKDGRFAQSWTVGSAVEEFATAGAFRLKQYAPGQRLVLERNPFYWKADGGKHRLPYLDQIVFLIVPTQDAEVIHFQAGDVDLIDNISAENYGVLERRQDAKGYQLYDLGPGFSFLIGSPRMTASHPLRT